MIALCAVWLLVGLVGHDPWRGGDGAAFIDWLRTGTSEPMPLLYRWAAAATAWLTSPVLALHDGVRLASGIFIALAVWFTTRAARAQEGPETVWPAALTLLGSVGLLVRGHEINPNTAQFAAAALMLYGLARVPQQPQGAWALGGGGFLLALAGGAAEAAVLASLVLILPLLSPAWRAQGVRRAAWFGVAGGTVLTALWLVWVNAHGGSPALAQALDTARWHLSVSAYFPGILGWFAWPAWPLALWALYRDRRRWREPARLMPLAALLLLLALYSFSADPGEDQGLVLLLPLALLGGAGLLTLRRGAANALLWFALMLFGFLALVLWVYWSAHDLGAPARLAARLSRLGMADVGSLRPWALVLGGVVTAGWIVFLFRVQRSPLRPMLVWTAGVTFIWTLLFALFQGPLDRRVGYTELAAELARQVPAGACVETYGVRSVAGGLMAYHSGRDFRPVDSGCPWLLVQIRQKGSLPPVTSDWVPRAEIARPNHRDDHFMLYARR